MESATPKHRSSPFPFIDLGKAIARAREFHVQQRHHPAPAHVAMGLWGYGVKSSGGAQTIATLKQFGLMTDDGSGTDRRVVLTEMALQILRDAREPSADRDRLIQKAALIPKLHQELWEKYGSELPSLPSVAYFLEAERGGFTPQSARALISEYVETISFARLGSGGTIPPSTQEVEKDMHEPIQRPDAPASRSAPIADVIKATERAVFAHEVEPQHGLRLIVEGEVDDEILDALELFVSLQRKRIERRRSH